MCLVQLPAEGDFAGAMLFLSTDSLHFLLTWMLINHDWWTSQSYAVLFQGLSTELKDTFLHFLGISATNKSWHAVQRESKCA